MKLALRNNYFLLLASPRSSAPWELLFFNTVFVASHALFKFAITWLILSSGSDLLYHFVGIQSRIRPSINSLSWFISVICKPCSLYLLPIMTQLQLLSLAFSVVCFMNILSDIISDYQKWSQMPILKRTFPSRSNGGLLLTNLSVFFVTAGQALGVWLLAINQQNFFLVAPSQFFDLPSLSTTTPI